MIYTKLKITKCCFFLLVTVEENRCDYAYKVLRCFFDLDHEVIENKSYEPKVVRIDSISFVSFI